MFCYKFLMLLTRIFENVCLKIADFNIEYQKSFRKISFPSFAKVLIIAYRIYLLNVVAQFR